LYQIGINETKYHLVNKIWFQNDTNGTICAFLKTEGFWSYQQLKLRIKKIGPYLKRFKPVYSRASKSYNRQELSSRSFENRKLYSAMKNRKAFKF
jgi:hypothetical protein